MTDGRDHHDTRRSLAIRNGVSGRLITSRNLGVVVPKIDAAQVVAPGCVSCGPATAPMSGGPIPFRILPAEKNYVDHMKAHKERKYKREMIGKKKYEKEKQKECRSTKFLQGRRLSHLRASICLDHPGSPPQEGPGP